MTIPSSLLHGDLTRKIIGAYYETYNELGTGFSELVCRKALGVVLRGRGMRAMEEVPIPVRFRDHLLATFSADIVVDALVLIEVKAVKEIEPWHRAQVMNYLKGSDLELGLLMNFGPMAEVRRFIFTADRKRGDGLAEEQPVDPQPHTANQPIR